MKLLHVRPQAERTVTDAVEPEFSTIQAAAEAARPGDTILIHPGLYRERISPARGGEPDAPITFRAVEKGTAIVRGSDLFEQDWLPVPGRDRLHRIPLDLLPSGVDAYRGVADPTFAQDFSPYIQHFNRRYVARPMDSALELLHRRAHDLKNKIADSDGSGTELLNWKEKLAQLEVEIERRSDPSDPLLFPTLGQLFVDGAQLLEVETTSLLETLPGSWLVSPDGAEIWVHFAGSQPGRPHRRAVEIAVRHTLFAPIQRGLGHLHLIDLVFEHGCNWFPTWGEGGWSQSGLISTRSGHHWTIRGCTVRLAKSIGIDCGSEGGREQAEGGMPHGGEHAQLLNTSAGYHLIEDNDISDHGHCGLCGIGHRGTRVLRNRIERNNSLGLTAPWWEFGGIKFHFCFDALIEGNIVRDNEAHGIWLDNQFQGTRVTRNLIVNNLWSGVNLEYGRGPCLVDTNVIALTRQGDGIYGHDAAGMTIAHNLLYGNAGFGVWLAYCTSRVPVADACSDHQVLNNMILANKAGAVSLPLPWAGASNNRSEGNLLMGAGQTLDEGSGPFPPLFQINNKSHCAQFPHICPGPEPQTAEVVMRNLFRAMDEAGLPSEQRPNQVMLEHGYFLPLDAWRAVLGNDLNSRVIRVTRDGLSTRQPVFTFLFDGTEKTVECESVKGVTKDYYGHALAERPLPGPFQRIRAGEIKFPLHPAP